jgi:hypothetical protein
MTETFQTVFVEPWRRLTEMVAEFLPEVFAAVLLFAAGLGVAWLFSKLALKVMHAARADRLFASMGATDAFRRAGFREGPGVVLARVLFWLVVLLFAIVALSVLGMPAVDHLMERFVLYLPNILVALVIVLVGHLLGNFLGRTVLITLVNMGSHTAGILSRLVQWGIFLLALSMSLEQLGIGRKTVLAAFTISFGGLVLALALAFGLGGRDLARELLERWF